MGCIHNIKACLLISDNCLHRLYKGILANEIDQFTLKRKGSHIEGYILSLRFPINRYWKNPIQNRNFCSSDLPGQFLCADRRLRIGPEIFFCLNGAGRTIRLILFKIIQDNVNQIDIGSRATGKF